MAQQAIPSWDFKGRGNAYTSIAGQFDLSGNFLMVSKKASTEGENKAHSFTLT